MQLIFTGGFLTLLLATTINTLPRKSRGNLQEFMGHGTNELTIAVLQGYVEKDSNLAFSPLGYSTLLAVLAEGARGETKNQLVSALHLPNSQQLTRESYKNVLEGLRHNGEPPVSVPVDQGINSNKDGKDVPEFRNWFYIYKNFSVDSDYKDVLLNNYLTEVRNVERIMDDDLPEISDVSDSNKDISMENEMKKSESVEQSELSQQNEETNKINMPVVPVINKDNSVLDKDTESMKISTKLEKEKDQIINAVPEITTNADEILNNNTNNSDESPTTSEISKPNDEVKKIVKDEEAMNIATALMEEALQNHAIREDAMIESILKEQEDSKSQSDMDGALNMNFGLETTTASETKISDTANLETGIVKEDEKIGNVMESQKDLIELQTEENDAVTTQNVKEQNTESPQPTNEKNAACNNITENVTEDSKLKQEKQKDEKDNVASEKETQHEKNKEVNEKVDAEKEKGEMMLAVERSRKTFSHKNNEQEARGIASGISGNRIVQKSSQKPDSVMIIFNALYYKGTWESPLTKQPSDLPDVFYKSDSEKINTPFLHSIGSYKVGAVPDLDSVAIELPYKGGRYSLLVILPNQRNGLRSLIADQLTSDCLKNIGKHLSRKEVQVCIPKFQVETVTKPVESLKKFGITDIFSQEKADLSGLSKEPGLYVDDVAQFVTINVDRDGSAANYLTSSSILPASTRNGEYEKFVADHPFLFFVRDNNENVVVVAGKVMDPASKSM